MSYFSNSNRKQFKSVGNVRNVISCDAVAPAMFRTRMTEAILDRDEAVVAESMPMGRIGRPGELALTVLFLASEGASYITGQVVAIDGGRTAQ
jgi:NAD(P)-dependent dehydrogenase (short-subunit alcohol dehydrogenase family)